MGKSSSSGKPPAGGIHAGHRGRMRQRFLASGLEGFQEHEILELLLFYAVPRRDVNAMAHMLIQRFGSFSAVLDASEEELCSIPGVGPGVAHFLKLVPQVMVQMARRSGQEEALSVRTATELQRFLTLRCPDGPVGQLLLLLADPGHHVVALHRLERFEALNVRELATHAVGSRASQVVLVERVEDCTGFPPPGRCQAVDRLAEDLRTLNIPLWDYFTVDALGHLPCSFARTGQLLPR